MTRQELLICMSLAIMKSSHVFIMHLYCLRGILYSNALFVSYSRFILIPCKKCNHTYVCEGYCIKLLIMQGILYSDGKKVFSAGTFAKILWITFEFNLENVFGRHKMINKLAYILLFKWHETRYSMFFRQLYLFKQLCIGCNAHIIIRITQIQFTITSKFPSFLKPNNLFDILSLVHNTLLLHCGATIRIGLLRLSVLIRRHENINVKIRIIIKRTITKIILVVDIYATSGCVVVSPTVLVVSIAVEFTVAVM